MLEVVYFVFKDGTPMRGEALGGAPGPYLLQAGIAACHARARTPEDTDWRRIVATYDQLAATAPSPIVELNRAVAVSFADGSAAGLAIVDRLAKLPALEGYHLVPTVRADFFSRLGRRDEARAEFERAASLTDERPRTRPASAPPKRGRGQRIDVTGARRPAATFWREGRLTQGTLVERFRCRESATSRGEVGDARGHESQLLQRRVFDRPQRPHCK